MVATARPRRSVLYMPGSNARALEKAKTLPADALIFDLEDAVAPDAKAEARARVCAAAREGGYGLREIVIRANGLATPWGYADLSAIAISGAAAVLLPKVESAQQVRDAVAVIEAAGAPETMAVWCMMETPRGALKAAEIAESHPRLAALVMGTSDLAKDLHAAHTPERLPFLTALGLCLLAARANGLAILDGVHLDLADDAGFEAACRQGLELGFDGKTLIHPKTIDTANRVFAPSEAEIDWSRRIIAAHEAAAAEGKGVVLVDGKLIENLHVAAARRLVAMAAAIAEMAAG
ncbi:MAG TPA: CoA ester lyase [Acetobacteraceae bacterium]|nr:CoA ester lyase [Acetobacteraceae bacterium]